MNHEVYMQAAIAVAKKSTQDGGAAIGAIIVDPDGEIIARGESIVAVAHDPTAHAEINCIRAVAEARGSDDLFDCVLYSTLEPCHMCLSAAAWSKIPQVFFGAYRRDVDETLFDITGNFSDEQEAPRMNLRDGIAMHVQGGVLEEACAALLAGYHEISHHTRAAPLPSKESTSQASDASPIPAQNR